MTSGTQNLEIQWSSQNPVKELKGNRDLPVSLLIPPPIEMKG